MELDWSTFTLQILNFLVLVWLLKRFLYKPVSKVITDRQGALDRIRADAERLRVEGETLKQRYEGRLAEWEQEKAKARALLLEEHGAERARLMEELRASLEQERQKTKAREERRRQELHRQAEEAALAQGARFAARLLERLARQDLTAQLAALTLEELRELPDERRQTIRSICRNGESSAQVLTAHRLDDTQQAALATALEELAGRPVTCVWAEDASLLAGLRISLGPWVLASNLRDELKGFMESAYADDVV
jgi:F-type H+-transporting ATPase subunit b